MPRRNTGPKLKWLAKRSGYYAVWYEGGREKLHSLGTADLAEAESAFAEFLRERQRGQRPDRPRDPDQITIAEVLDFYGDEHAPSTAAPERIAYAIDALLPFWGEKLVSAITKQTCKDYVTQRKRAPATVRRELTTLRAALNFAAGEKRLSSVPKVELPQKPSGRERWLTRQEAATLLNASRTGRSDVRLYLPLFILMGIYTGARKGAILSLRWAQVDLDAERIDFRTPSERRTNKRKARIPIPRPLLTFLKLARKRGTPTGFVVHDANRPIKDIGDSKHGSFGRACSRAGLTDVPPHTLRHTCGTWLAQGGTDLWNIAGWLGQSYATTVELYAHHHPDFMEEAKSAMERGANRKGTSRKQSGVTRT